MEAVAAAAAVAAIFIYFGKPGTGRIAAVLALVLMVAVRVRWELRRCAWFWATVALVAVAEVPAVVFVPWTSRWIPAAVMLPFGIADVVVILLLIQAVEKWMDHPGAR